MIEILNRQRSRKIDKQVWSDFAQRALEIIDLSSKTAKIDSSRLCRVSGNVLGFRDWSPNGGQACSTRRSESAAPTFSR